MKGITNAPMGAGGSGGGWTEHSSYDWSDIFEWIGSESKLHAKKDFYMIGKSGIYETSTFIPKDAKFPNYQTFPLVARETGNWGTKIHTNEGWMLSEAAITSSSLSIYFAENTLSISNNAIVNTVAANISNSVNKSGFKVYTRD